VSTESRTNALHAVRRVVVFEPNPRGHRLYYVRLLLEALFQSGSAPEVLTRRGVESEPQWALHLGEMNVPVRYIDAQSSLAELSQYSEDHDIDLLVVPDADRLLIDAALGRWHARGHVSLLAMRPDSQHGHNFRAAAWGLTKRLLIFAADHRARVRAAALKSALTPQRRPIRWVSDPVTLACSLDDVRSCRATLNADETHFWVGVFGAVTPRKNLHLIAEAALRVPGVALLVAGSVDDEAQRLAEEPLRRLSDSGRPVVLRTEALRDEEFDTLISSMDCVAVAHSNEGSSGIVGKAFAASRPLVLAGAQSLKADAAAIGEFAAWSPLDTDAIARNIERFASMPRPDITLRSNTDDFVKGLL